MKDGFRQSMAWLHTWSGISVGWVLYFIFLTGTAGYFSAEISRWMRPELPLSSAPIDSRESVRIALARLQEDAPDADQWTITMPDRVQEPFVRLAWHRPGVDGGAATTAVVYPGMPLGPDGARAVERETGGGAWLYQMHYRLNYFDLNTAAWIVGFCSMCMLVSILSGVITHKKIFSDFFTFRPRRGQRSWLDAHNALAVVALPFHLMITYSGLVLLMITYMPLVLSATYGPEIDDQIPFFDATNPRLKEQGPSGTPATLLAIEPLLDQAERDGQAGSLVSIRARYAHDANARITVTQQYAAPLRGNYQQVFDGVTGERIETTPERTGPWWIHDLLIGLHEGRYAGPVLRWLYFLSGVIGTAMVATGLVLWTVKRRERSVAGKASRALKLVERMNVGTIVGLPIGIAAYFLANRLIPADLAERGAWETHVLFIVWAATLCYAALRPVGKAWIELCSLAAALFFALPLVNLATTQRHLGVTIPHDHWRGEWSLAGFDLTMLGLGVLFVGLAIAVRHHVGLRLQPRPERSASLMASAAPEAE
ncbi:MAG: PepSY-associated TM helix domain-containing protein [Steroidobacteraceae bacterium]